MVKSSEFHKFIKKHGKKRGWYYTGESEGSHRIYKDSDGIPLSRTLPWIQGDGRGIEKENNTRYGAGIVLRILYKNIKIWEI